MKTVIQENEQLKRKVAKQEIIIQEQRAQLQQYYDTRKEVRALIDRYIRAKFSLSGDT